MSYNYTFKVFLNIENSAIASINKTMEAFTWEKQKILLGADLWDMTISVNSKLDADKYKQLVDETQVAYTEIMSKDIVGANITLTLKSEWEWEQSS